MTARRLFAIALGVACVAAAALVLSHVAPSHEAEVAVRNSLGHPVRLSWEGRIGRGDATLAANEVRTLTIYRGEGPPGEWSITMRCDRHALALSSDDVAYRSEPGALTTGRVVVGLDGLSIERVELEGGG